MKVAEIRWRMNPDRVAVEGDALLCTGGNYEELEGAHKGAINNLAWLHDSTGLVSASNDETIKLWTFFPDPPTLALESTLEGHKDCVLNVAVTSDRRVVSCCHDSTCRVWDAKSQRIIRRLVGHSRVVYAAALANRRPSPHVDVRPRQYRMPLGCFKGRPCPQIRERAFGMDFGRRVVAEWGLVCDCIKR